MKFVETLAFIVGIAIFASLVVQTPEMIMETVAMAVLQMFGEL